MPILGSLGCEWLLCLAIFHTCLWCLFLALQFVSGYFALQYFMPAHDAYSWLSRMWVATLPCNILWLLMMLVLDSAECEWLLCPAIFHACSWCLFLALQMVSGYFALQYFMPILGSLGCEWLLCLAIFHICSWCLFFTLQVVSGYFALQYFMLAYDAYSWLSRMWVLCLAIFHAYSWCLFLAL